MLSIPITFDLTKVPELKHFWLVEETLNPSESPRKELNNSIRKKLFDQNSEDLSSSTTTTVNTPCHMASSGSSGSIIMQKLKSANEQLCAQSGRLNKIAQLPKPEVYNSSEQEANSTMKKELKPRTLASSSSSATTDDCWRDSFDFEVGFQLSHRLFKVKSISWSSELYYLCQSICLIERNRMVLISYVSWTPIKS